MGYQQTQTIQAKTMEDLFKTLPQYTCSWPKDLMTFYNYQAHWNLQDFLEGEILAQKNFKADPSDIFVCSSPKTGTTWLKALAFAIVTRKQFDESTSPLLTTMPHECIPFLEKDLKQIEENHSKSETFPLVSTHLPYASLPESIISSNCKIVYIYRNIKDVIVSYYHFIRNFAKLTEEEAPFEALFDEFYQGISWYGPFCDHILGYWKASLEKPDRILFLKYEDMKKDTVNDVKRLAEFMGCPFSTGEEKAGVIENIVKLCDFKNLSNLEVNKSGKHRADDAPVENRIYFRKAKVGDWENHFTNEMKEKIDKLVDEKLGETGLVLK